MRCDKRRAGISAALFFSKYRLLAKNIRRRGPAYRLPLGIALDDNPRQFLVRGVENPFVMHECAFAPV